MRARNDRVDDLRTCRTCERLRYLTAALAGACLGLAVAAVRPAPALNDAGAAHAAAPIEATANAEGFRAAFPVQGAAPRPFDFELRDEGPQRFSGSRDPWLYGPSVQVFLREGWARPYVRLSAGRDARPEELQAALWLSQVVPENLGGSVGGGMALQLTEQLMLDLNASHYRGSNDPLGLEPFTHVGAGLQLWF